MTNPYRFLCLFLLACVSPALAGEKSDLHQQLLEMADRQQKERRAHFAAATTKADVETLQKSLREKFVRLLDGLPQSQGVPHAKILGTIEAEDYVIEKLVFESSPGYFVPALLYKPKNITARLPAILSPCGHSPAGKAEFTYQILHINLVKARLHCFDLRPRRPGRTQPILGRCQSEVALQPCLRRTRGSRQSTLLAGDKPGPLSHI